MKLLLLIDTKEYAYHTGLVDDFKYAIIGGCENLDGGAEFCLLDMNCGKPEHEIFYSIRDGKYDTIITLDGAGFSLKNELDGLSLNAITCRMAHIFLQSSDKYRSCFASQMNFSMFVYVKSAQDVLYISKTYPDVPNVSALEGIIYKNASEAEQAENKRLIGEWFKAFCTDARIK